MSKETILIVDDSPDLLEMLDFMLASQHNIVKAYDGRAGLLAAQQTAPDSSC